MQNEQNNPTTQSLSHFIQPAALAQIGSARINRFLAGFSQELNALGVAVPEPGAENGHYFSSAAALFAGSRLPERLRNTLHTLEKAASPENEDRLDTMLAEHIPNLSVNGRSYLDRALELWFFLNSDTTANWIGNLTNHDIRHVLELSRDVINSPHLGFDEAVKAYIIGTAFQIPEHRIRHALIKGRYDVYVAPSRKFVHNIFDLMADLQTTPLMGLRILQSLKDAALKHGVNKGSYLPKADFLQYMTGMGIEPAAVKLWLDVMLKKGLVLNYDPTCVDENSASQLEISPAGELHLYWGKGNFDYLFAMAEVTPIREKGTFDEMFGIYAKNAHVQYRDFVEKIVSKFIGHLFAEDGLFCKVPEHPSYTGQLDITRKLQGMIAQASSSCINP
jgi:hypothetical protein